MKIELSLDELCLVAVALGNNADAFRARAAREQAGSYDALAAAQHAANCDELADRLHNELEAAEHAERLLDNME